jgi:hypothetical protein
MAVQLARLSLWLTTLASDRPLTFLDHHLAAGDSLLGASLYQLTRLPAAIDRTGARPAEHTLPLFPDEAADRMLRTVLPDRFRLAVEPEDTPEAVRGKERTLAALTAPGAPLARWKTAADLWCAAWFSGPRSLTPGVYADLLGSILGERAVLAPHHRATILDEAETSAAAQRFFHWELEFPEVFFDAAGRRRSNGGFDAVIGNPPWDALRADTGDRDARARARETRDAHLRFLRTSGIYQYQGPGHANRYRVFVERAMQLVRPGGRIALVLPSGLAIDHGSGPIRRALLDSTRIDRLIGFENRRGIFPIHRDVKFLLLTATAGLSTDRLSGVYGKTDAGWLDELPDASADDPVEARSIALDRTLLESWDREHLAFPMLQQSIDAEILAHATAGAPALGDRCGWGASFGRELNATEDRHHFVARPEALTSERSSPAAMLPIVEGKHLDAFRLTEKRSPLAIPWKSAASLLDPRRSFDRPRIAYRDVASATNRLTLIAAMLPAGVVSTHTVFCLKSELDEENRYCLLGLMNSLAANYLVRLQVTTHVTTTLMSRLPVPHPQPGSPQFTEIVFLTRTLERDGLTNIAAYARLNAIVFALYAFSSAHVSHIVSTFPLLPDELRRACIASVHGRATETPRHGEDK